jgi:type II secretory pathway pseudopilin PulG
MIKLKPRIKNKAQSPEAGYTIIESLVAMIMVAALMVAVAPVIVFSVGTRVQARRVELASQAARSYIDAVRSGELDPPTITALATYEDEAPEETEKRASLQNALESCASALDNGDPDTPDDLVYCQTEIVNSGFGQFYCADGDGDGVCTPNSVADMMVLGGIVVPTGNSQGEKNYRNGIIQGTQARKDLGYKLLVMVYRASALGSTDIKINNQPISNMINNAALASRFSEGGEEIERPLFTATSEVPPAASPFQNLRDRLDREE